MSKQDYIEYLKTWFPKNKVKGLLSQIAFEEEFESGFLSKHKAKFYPGCWVISPKSYESNKFRYVISVHEKMLDHEPEVTEMDSVLGSNKENFFKIADFLENSSFGVIYAVPFSYDGKINFTKINSDDFSAVKWSLFFYNKGEFVKKNPIDFFLNWRDGKKPNKPKEQRQWDNVELITSKLEKFSENTLEAFVLKDVFYVGLLKSIVKISTDDPYDVDCFIVSSNGNSVFPLELKEKSPVFKTYKDGTTNVHFFGIDTGRISCLERLCSASDSNAFYVVREVDGSEDRNLVGWKVMTLAGIVMASSWNPAPGGTGMTGGGTSTASLPYGEFDDLTESTFDDVNLSEIYQRSSSVKRIADRYGAERVQRESVRS